MPERQPERRTSAVGDVPMLRVVGDNEYSFPAPTAVTSAAPIVVPAADEVMADVEPRPPMTYRIAGGLARLAGDRQPSVQECIDYALHGDWTVAGPKSVTRQLHLLVTLVCCLVPGMAGAFLIWVSRKPSRFCILVLSVIILFLAGIL